MHRSEWNAHEELMRNVERERRQAMLESARFVYKPERGTTVKQKVVRAIVLLMALALYTGLMGCLWSS